MRIHARSDQVSLGAKMATYRDGERETMRLIRDAVEKGSLGRTFRGGDVNRALRINWGGNFLAKHRVGNPGAESERFVLVERGLYRLKS
jgi:hypothetical protein